MSDVILRRPMTADGTCSSCGARIVWAVTEADKRIPLDADPETRGVLVTRGTTTKLVIAATYRPHFATCPQAAQHRKKTT